MLCADRWPDSVPKLSCGAERGADVSRNVDRKLGGTYDNRPTVSLRRAVAATPYGTYSAICKRSKRRGTRLSGLEMPRVCCICRTCRACTRETAAKYPKVREICGRQAPELQRPEAGACGHAGSRRGDYSDYSEGKLTVPCRTNAPTSASDPELLELSRISLSSAHRFVA